MHGRYFRRQRRCRGVAAGSAGDIWSTCRFVLLSCLCEECRRRVYSRRPFCDNRLTSQAKESEPSAGNTKLYLSIGGCLCWFWVLEALIDCPWRSSRDPFSKLALPRLPGASCCSSLISVIACVGISTRFDCLPRPRCLICEPPNAPAPPPLFFRLGFACLSLCTPSTLSSAAGRDVRVERTRDSFVFVSEGKPKNVLRMFLECFAGVGTTPPPPSSPPHPLDFLFLFSREEKGVRSRSPPSFVFFFLVRPPA